MGLFNDNTVTIDYMNQMNNIFFEAGCLFSEFEDTPTKEKEHWFHLFRDGTFTKYELTKICEIISEQIIEYDLICEYERYSHYDEIYIRRK